MDEDLFDERPAGNVMRNRIVAPRSSGDPESEQPLRQPIGPRPARVADDVEEGARRMPDEGIARLQAQRRMRMGAEGEPPHSGEQQQRMMQREPERPQRPQERREEPARPVVERQREQPMRREQPENRMRMSSPQGVRPAPRHARGFIGASELYKNKAKLATVPATVLFIADVVTTTLGIAWVYSVAAGTTPPTWVYLLAILIALWVVYLQVVFGPSLWYSIRDRNTIAEKVVKDKKTGTQQKVQYYVDIDWTDAMWYFGASIPDIYCTTSFFWFTIVYPVINRVSEGDPSKLALAAGVALCLTIALAASIMPIVTLIRNDVGKYKAKVEVE